MKTLNEFSTGYPSAINNAQSQEYQGALGPIDAETVQGQDRFNPKTPEGLHRINNFISHFFKRITLNPQNEIAQLRVRLNHLTMDFPFDNTYQVQEVNNFPVTFGGSAFGVTPTTDLSVGFDNGSDLPRYNLQVRSMKTDGGFKLEGKLTPADEIAESYLKKSNRSKRIDKFKKIMEANEKATAARLRDPSGEIRDSAKRDATKVTRELTKSRSMRRR